MLSELKMRTYEAILEEELVLAMGCTEPIAIAYAAAILRTALHTEPEQILAGLSGNIIKNVKSVIVPATGGRHGIPTAIAAGVVSGRADLKLEVLSALDESSGEKIEKYLADTRISVEELNTPCTFELHLEATSGDHRASVRIVGAHTNVTSVTFDDTDITAEFSDSASNVECHEKADRSLLTVEEIVEYATICNLEKLAPLLKRQIDLNMAIAEEGLSGKWGAAIGKILLTENADISKKARAYAAAGSDARMSGCELPVSIISGSGNQGITASVPVVVYARELGKSEEELLRALIVSDLVTIHQKTGIGTLSAYCGAISAGVGAGAGICYLRGGDFYMIAHTLVNAVAILSGTICDGAKPSCAAKIAMAVEAGIMGYDMAKAGSQFYGGDGIVTKGVENTIRNVGRLAKDGMSETDKEIIRIMLGKN